MPYDVQQPAASIEAPSESFGAPASIEPLAPWQHTAGVVLLLILWAGITHGHVHAEFYSNHVVSYISSCMMGWMLLGTVVAGLYRRKAFFITTLQRSAALWRIEALRALAVFGTYIMVAGIITVALHASHLHASFDQGAVEAAAPHTILELLLWFAVSFTAGFCEEHVFRGYLLPQCIAWLQKAGASFLTAAALSVVATSILFGSLHLYEGVGGAIIIGFLGAIYACYAISFRNLRAVILAHFMQDFLIGAWLYARHLHHA
jgi:uncharacterized protein